MRARHTSGMHRALRNVCAAAATAVAFGVYGQVAFPDHYIQDVAWTEGTHHYTLAQPIIAPGDAQEPTIISGTANSELVSGTSVHLTEGFHAGNFSTDGHFHARIDEGIDGADAVAIITPAPDHIVDGMLHVEKWEKLEVGLKLHPEYLEAITNFFAHYYPQDPYPYDPTIVNENISEPGNVDAVHDLNPYADDSLQVFMTLADPDGGQRMKWAFYMREVKWGAGGDLALPLDDPDSPLDAYRMRFRFAPDKEGPWQFRIGIRAPHTLDANNVALPQVNYASYSFFCDPPLEGKHGRLHVNATNKLLLQHEDRTAFFGLGTNMADVIHDRGDFAEDARFYQRDMNVMKQTMDQLHEVGGNFLRMMQSQQHFAHEAFNLGVYDRYRGIVTCENGLTNERGDCQHQSWSFDQLLEHAAQNNIYIQLCVEPTHPAFGSDHLWGSPPYVTEFLNTARETDGTYLLKKYFYKNGDPSTRDDVNDITARNVFYFWKRKYKYLMNRWGYSPSLAIIEPFNEIDQMLGYYREHNLVGNTSVCELNRRVWPVQPGLPETLYSWLTDITDYVRDPVDPGHPVASPLGEKKLFLMSYAWNDPERDNYQTFFKPFYNAKVDLMDAHRYLGNTITDANTPDGRLHHMVSNVHGYVDRTPNANFPAKPFNTGETNYATDLDGSEGEIEKIFHNYDVSFHNEIWAGAFSGRFATGNTWHWERVFWWPDALPVPRTDPGNEHQQIFSNGLGATNNLDIGISDTPIPLINRRLHHHFKPLADLLSDQLWLDYEFLSGNYTPRKVFDTTPVLQNPDDLESYYLVRESIDPLEDQNLAIGWVHNRYAKTMNNYYLHSALQNFLGCTPPTPSSSITLTGFAPYTDFYVTWFPTRMNSTVLPQPTPSDEPLQSNASGHLTINFEPGQFGGIVNNYMDTLRTDYAFIISPEPFFKSRQVTPEPESTSAKSDWDFALFPNPTRDELFLKLPDDAPKDIVLYDISGRQIQIWGSITGPAFQVDIGQFAKGMYSLRVFSGSSSRTKKLILH